MKRSENICPVSPARSPPGGQKLSRCRSRSNRQCRNVRQLRFPDVHVNAASHILDANAERTKPVSWLIPCPSMTPPGSVDDWPCPSDLTLVRLLRAQFA